MNQSEPEKDISKSFQAQLERTQRLRALLRLQRDEINARLEEIENQLEALKAQSDEMLLQSQNRRTTDQHARRTRLDAKESLLKRFEREAHRE